MKRGVDKSLDDVLISQREAQRVVGDAAIREAFEDLKQGYLDAWSRTKPDEAAKRELAYMHFKAVADVWGALERKAQSAHVRDLKAKAEEKGNG